MVQVKAKLDDFMNYNNLSTYYHITIIQHLSDDLIEKQQEFLAFVTYQCIQYEYFLAFIVVLTCMADGTKLLPLIIFKLKNIPRGNFPLLELIQKDG
ncbi:hypothetical protein RhiirA5_427116 [Rhizophagus irregularis]|uniref:Uncharacterized protein n=1 Tax=Rhizophagus irregularis TaxID=588596 RepID=A0A2N0P2Y5_9GLOM|nr:hypothetical protein RhiirA5_427116 [Rhizophagus irregularis]